MNNENQNNVKQNNAKKLPGFYIALCCCVLVIGIAGYFTETHTTDKSSTVMNNETVTEEDTPQNVVSVATAAPSLNMASIEVNEPSANDNNDSMPVVSEPLADYAADNPDVDETAITVSSEQPAFIMPVNGEIIGQYSDSLVYNNALADWRTHNGIDISAEKGCSVQSVASGVVDKITEDVMGSCVEISHSGGFVTRYMGLDNIENLSEGKEIQSGEVLGTVGDCKGENVTESHLHFEMTKDGNAVNPSDYLPH